MPAALSGPLLSLEYLRAESALEREGFPSSAITRFRAMRARCRDAVGPASPPEIVFAVAARSLAAWLGWPAPSGPPVQAGHAARWPLVAAGTPVVQLLVVPYGQADRPGRLALGAALAAGSRWCLIVDGHVLRLVDCLRADGHAFVEFDLDACADDLDSLAWLARLGSPAAFMDDAGALTRWLRDSDAHGRRVCRALRAGVAEALATFTDAVSRAPGPRRDLRACYPDALVAVYRVLFLLFAEARQLVPMWHPIYRRGYSIDALRARLAEGRSPRGSWAALQAIARLAHAGAIAGDLRVTPFNGRLFAPARAPLLDHLALDDDRVGRALEALCFTRASAGSRRQRIAYAELGVEELGSVYENLLDCEPAHAPAPGAAGRAAAPAVHLRRAASEARKSTGTFYTPRALTERLVRETLEPLVAGRPPDEILSLRVLDPAMGSGAFLVSASRYLADRWEQAMLDRGEAAPGDITEVERAATRRTIASRCLFGVDRNPMAVQLAQLSIWLASLAADRPLSFLDHHLVAGNSLVGTSPIAVLARPPGRAAVTAPLPLESLFEWSDGLSAIRAGRDALEREPDDSAEAVRAKDATLARLASADTLRRWKAACDLWCAAWLPDRPAEGVYHSILECVLAGSAPPPATRAVAQRLAAAARAMACFHWPLEFPEVFLDANGRLFSDAGFDAIVGNPPWEMLRADSRREASARPDGAALVRFARASGTYTAQGRGHANQVQLFVERALHLTRPGGRLGLVVPASLLTDEGSAPLRRALVRANGVESITVFDNRRGLFPIHRSVRFATLVASRHGHTTGIRCRFGVTDPAPDAGDRAPVVLGPGLLERLSGPGLAIPDLPTATDVRLVEALTARHPRLSDPTGWKVTFGRELNATDDRDCFTATARAGAFPVVEGRHLSPYRVDLSAVTRRADPRRTMQRLGPRAAVGRPRLAYRDVASATNRTTLIAALLPAGVVSVHTVFCANEPLPPADARVLCALLNSVAANYLVRRWVTTHVTASLLAALPVPAPARGHAWFEELDELAETLAARDDPAASARAHACAAEAYGLDATALEHVLGTFPLIPRGERDAVLDAYGSRAAAKPATSSPSTMPV